MGVYGQLLSELVNTERKQIDLNSNELLNKIDIIDNIQLPNNDKIAIKILFMINYKYKTLITCLLKGNLLNMIQSKKVQN